MTGSLSQASRSPIRFPLIDHLRAIAIVAMVFYHATYDSVLFRLVNVNLKHPGWEAVPNTIVALFLFCVGSSLAIGHADQIHWKPYFQRLSKVAAGALTVSVVTRVLFPQQWVYFGTLHVITFSSIVALPFLQHPKISLLAGLTLLLGPTLSGIEIPWIRLTHSSMDYIPPVPWTGWVLLGIFAFHHGVHKIKVPEWRVSTILSKHSLKIYLTHQAILYGLISGIAYLISANR